MSEKDEKVSTDIIARQHLSRLAERLLANIGGADDLQRLKDMTSTLAGNPPLRKNIALLIRDFCADHMRPEVKKFAGLMEMKLLKHDPARGAKGWKRDDDPQQHLARLSVILEELAKALKDGNQVGLKAADLANHAMMLADIAGELDEV